MGDSGDGCSKKLVHFLESIAEPSQVRLQSDGLAKQIKKKTESRCLGGHGTLGGRGGGLTWVLEGSFGFFTRASESNT